MSVAYRGVDPDPVQPRPSFRRAQIYLDVLAMLLPSWAQKVTFDLDGDDCDDRVSISFRFHGVPFESMKEFVSEVEDRIGALNEAMVKS